jgi:hypothetical protein
MMWNAEWRKLPDGRGLWSSVDINSRSLTFAEVIRGWQKDPAFRTWFNSRLADVPFSAFRWEMPGVTSSTIDSRPFEFVVLESPGLNRPSDPHSFAKHFTESKTGVVTFPNLGGDAVMVVPRPVADASAYGHVAAFVRHAPATQQDELWLAVSTAMARRVGVRPVWLSTAGAGVTWLHVRLDDRPKYYGHEPYRKLNWTE